MPRNATLYPLSLVLALFACSGEQTEGLATDADASISVGGGAGDGRNRCGDGERGAREPCDGNDLGGETCTGLGLGEGVLRCLTTCRFDTSACTTPMVCGDGQVVGTETCDDGNTVSEDGCSSECAVETERCGDGCVQRARGELCEVGQRVVETCTDLTGRPQGIERCTASCGFSAPECARPDACGNGLIDLGESCDDGNADEGDGCSSRCLLESGCGDGVRQELEACDGQDLGGASCSSFGFTLGELSCASECYLDLSACRSPVCGDGRVDAGEACDDGNAESGDGCTCACVIELCPDGSTPMPMWPDEDGDGHGDRDRPPAYLCSVRPRFAPQAGDCDDRLDYVHTGALERCNGADDDCNGAMDDAVIYRDWYPDKDHDGYGDVNGTSIRACDAPEAHIDNNRDCDDRDSNIRPTATEVCDGADNDCDGVYNEDAQGAALRETCYGGPSGTLNVGLCRAGSRVCGRTGWGSCTGDVRPAPEVCDGLDNNCDSRTDDGLTFSSYWPDGDSDGYGNVNGTPVQACARPTGRVANNGDCNDSVSAIRPNATEGIGDEADQNCDGRETCYVDGDGDQHRVATTVVSADLSCRDRGEARATLPADDCDDVRPSVHPGASEVCDGLNNDCNANTADGSQDPGLNQPCDGADSDLCADGQRVCSQGALACNDDATAIQEVCNGTDDNCNGSTDEGVTTTFYRDGDGDQYGLGNDTAQLCSPSGFYRATIPGDCNDDNRLIHPNATEECNGIDDNCNGSGDEPRQCIGLTVAKSGNGGGRVWSNDQRIDCGETCSAGYDYGSSVVLMAQGDANNVFNGWVGCPNVQDGNCVVPNTSAMTVTAQFSTSWLYVNVAGRNGTTLTTRGNVVHTLNPSSNQPDDRINCVQRLCLPRGGCFDFGCSANYTPNQYVLLSADYMIPNTNCYFDGWSGCTSPDNQNRTCWQWVTGESVNVEARYYCQIIF